MVDNNAQHVMEKLRELVRSWGVSKFSEQMLLQWLKRFLSSEDDCHRLRKWVVLQLNQRRRIPESCSKWQMGCPQVIPLLRAMPVWNCDRFPWVKMLESNYTVIKQELLSLKDSTKPGFQPYRGPSWTSDINDALGSAGHDAGDWNVFYLFLHNVDFRANRELCPKTAALVESIDGHYDHAFFSALAPRTHVKKHHGPTNKKLRCHLPLVVPQGQCRLRAGNEVVYAQEGKCFIFDDSFEHEAWNDDDRRSRIVLIIDVWHPDLSAHEKKFFGYLRNAQLRADKRLCQGSSDNFYSIINKAGEAHAAAHRAVWG